VLSVFMMTTVAPGRGSPSLSTTVPLTETFCALAANVKHSATISENNCLISDSVFCNHLFHLKPSFEGLLRLAQEKSRQSCDDFFEISFK